MAQQSLMPSQQVAWGVPLARIEPEIRRLRRTALGIDSERWLVARASTLALVIYLENSQQEPAVCALVDQIARRHPLRAIVLVPEPAQAGSVAAADLYVTCQSSTDGGRHVSCEKIVLHLRGHTGPLTSILAPLLQYEAPTFLWWTAGLQPASPTLKELITIADRFILDVAQSAPTQNDLLGLIHLIRDHPRLVPSCTAWAHLAPWRYVTALLFDAPGIPPYLRGVRHARLDYISPAGSTDFPTTSALFLGWLTSQLGWQAGPITPLSGERAFQSEFRAGGHPLRVFLNGHAGAPSDVGDIRALIFESLGPAGEARFTITPADEPGVFCLTRQVAGRREASCELVAPVPTPEQVLLNELARLEHDTVFEQALTVAVRLFPPTTASP